MFGSLPESQRSLINFMYCKNYETVLKKLLELDYHSHSNTPKLIIIESLVSIFIDSMFSRCCQLPFLSTNGTTVQLQWKKCQWSIRQSSLLCKILSPLIQGYLSKLATVSSPPMCQSSRGVSLICFTGVGSLLKRIAWSQSLKNIKSRDKVFFNKSGK